LKNHLAIEDDSRDNLMTAILSSIALLYVTGFALMVHGVITAATGDYPDDAEIAARRLKRPSTSPTLARVSRSS